ncbi:hypothetical protein [Chryseobacterium sp.]|uniref:hypothetical protein n=1 Tax=Chryseobacterium sp. TaxID=1871047 RepID=UPI00388DE655
MKTFLSLGCGVIFTFLACSKQEPVNFVAKDDTRATYDTTAIDSFSNGAISVDIARKIRMSSQVYQDSLLEVLKVEKEMARLKVEELEKNKKNKETDANENVKEIAPTPSAP